MNGSVGRNDYTQKDVRVGGHPGVSAAHGARQVIERVPGGRREAKGVSGLSLNGLLANKLLAALPGEDFSRILPHLEPVTLSAGENLYKFEEGVHFAYFPENTVISNLFVLADGSTTEAAMIGREGLVGLSAVFNARQPMYWTRVLVGGSALRIRTEVLKQEFSKGGALQRALLTYLSARMAQLSQKAVCNGRHSVEERLCSWLLMVHDRADEDQLQLTHEQIAIHLGTRRAGITITAITLRERGIISCSRGMLCIEDRRALESAACECYQMFGQPVTR